MPDNMVFIADILSTLSNSLLISPEMISLKTSLAKSCPLIVITPFVYSNKLKSIVSKLKVDVF